ncbi:MAG TPA: dihydroorotase [Flavisolibacter sp.]
MQKYLIKNINIVNEGRIIAGDVLVSGGRIEKIGTGISIKGTATEINGEGKFLLPGVIDDQVHFREPGLTHKADIATESKAAVAGGVTSFMEMPNTVPPALTHELLEQKYDRAAHTSLANYSFFMGTSNDNADEVLRTNDRRKDVCGVKIFMGSSTGHLLVDNYLALDRIFRESEVLIAAHCEEEPMILANLQKLRAEKGALEPADHAVVRDAEECFASSFKAVQLAMKHNTRLHILHISTARELQLFTNMLPLQDKRITAEVCVHHLHFTADDYPHMGNLIKCNPAIKAPENRDALWQALLDDRLDVIATDHAPHTWAEKQVPEGFRWPATERQQVSGWGETAHAGLPLVQHSLMLMLMYYRQGRISLEKIAGKMSHAVADCFRIRERGYIREGYYADLVIIDPGTPYTVSKENILYKCGWSPLEGTVFPDSVSHTFVNGRLVYGNGSWDESVKGMRLAFDR